jgi:hypothetical protein
LLATLLPNSIGPICGCLLREQIEILIFSMQVNSMIGSTNLNISIKKSISIAAEYPLVRSKPVRHQGFNSLCWRTRTGIGALQNFRSGRVSSFGISLD